MSDVAEHRQQAHRLLFTSELLHQIFSFAHADGVTTSWSLVKAPGLVCATWYDVAIAVEWRELGLKAALSSLHCEPRAW